MTYISQYVNIFKDSNSEQLRCNLKKPSGEHPVKVFEGKTIAVTLILLMLVSCKTNTQPAVSDRHSHILSHVTETSVHKYLRPGVFLKGDDLAGYGTAVLGINASTNYILTASHLFSETQPGSDYYDFVELKGRGPAQRNHISHVAVDIIRANYNTNIIEDVALCHIGEPKLIERTSRVHLSPERPCTDMGVVEKTTQTSLTSLTTGETYTIIGRLTAVKSYYRLMLYEPVPGESGSGFWGDDSILYILSGNIPILPHWYERLGIPPEYKTLCLVTGVKIEW